MLVDKTRQRANVQHRICQDGGGRKPYFNFLFGQLKSGRVRFIHQNWNVMYSHFKNNCLVPWLMIYQNEFQKKTGSAHCANTCMHFWGLFRNAMIRYPFDSAVEEILFFKKLKLRFTSEIEYFRWVYQAVIWCLKL